MDEEKKKGRRERKESERQRRSHMVCLISGRIIWLAGGKLLYRSPKGRSDFLNHFNKLEECDCPASAAVSVLIRHSALSELATHEPTGAHYHECFAIGPHGKANLKRIIKIHCHLFKLCVSSCMRSATLLPKLSSVFN